MLHGCNGVRRTTAGGDANHNIFLAGFAAGDITPAHGARVFTIFGSMAQSFIAAGNYILNGLRVNVESWRALGGVQGGEPSAGACAYINQASAVADSFSNGINALGNLRQSPLYSRGNFAVFVVDDAGNLQGGQSIQIRRSAVLPFGFQLANGDFTGTHRKNTSIRASIFISKSFDDCVVEGGPDL